MMEVICPDVFQFLHGTIKSQMQYYPKHEALKYFNSFTVRLKVILVDLLHQIYQISIPSRYD